MKDPWILQRPGQKDSLESGQLKFGAEEGTEETLGGSGNGLGCTQAGVSPKGRTSLEGATHASGRRQGQHRQAGSPGGIGGP